MPGDPVAGSPTQRGLISPLAPLDLPPENLASFWGLEASAEGTWLPTPGLLTEPPSLDP